MTSPKYPFARLEVGENFAFPSHCASLVSMAAQGHGKRNNKKFTVRKDGLAHICERIA